MEKRMEIVTIVQRWLVDMYAFGDFEHLTHKREADYEIRYSEGRRTVEPVGSLLDECCPVFQERGDIRNCHER